jgi:uncharacterized membrane protein
VLAVAGATRCPECGARVGAYAAGCEACGADLEGHARRRRLEGDAELSRRRVAPINWGELPLSGWEAAYLLLTVFAVVWISVVGIVLGVLGVMHGYYEDRRGWTALCGALAAAALALELSRL